MIRKDIIELFRVPPGKKVRLKNYDPGWKQTEEFEELGKEALKERAKEILDQNLVDLAEALPDKHLRVVGDGPKRVPLEQRLAGKNVTFSGELRGSALAEAFASAKLFVFPSHTETFGQVVQEAMASGLPVVGVQAGGVADLVRPGETGLLAPRAGTSAHGPSGPKRPSSAL